MKRVVHNINGTITTTRVVQAALMAQKCQIYKKKKKIKYNYLLKQVT